MTTKIYTDQIMSDGTNVNLTIFETRPSNPVILFIPGMGCYADLYKDFLRDLAEKGFNVIGIDLVGHGHSGGARGRFTFQAILQNVSDATDYAAKNFNNDVNLLGSSFGGICALYAGIYEERLKTILCHGVMDARDFYTFSRFPRLFRIWTKYFSSTARLLPNLPIPLCLALDWNKVFEDKQRLERLKKDKTMVWTYSLGAFWSIQNFRPSRKFSQIKTPIKIVVGERDRIFQPEYCKALYNSLGSDHKSFEVIPNAGHMLPLEYPTKILPITVEWFKRK